MGMSTGSFRKAVEEGKVRYDGMAFEDICREVSKNGISIRR